MGIRADSWRNHQKIKKRGGRKLQEKMMYGGMVGSSSMNDLRRRDFEMNKDAYALVREEQAEIKKRKRFCHCGGWKLYHYKECSHCFKKTLEARKSLSK